MDAPGGRNGGRLNRAQLSGQVLVRGSLRHTPAGVPVIEFRLDHASEQVEAGHPRRVVCELNCVAFGEIALLLKEVPPGTDLVASGFLAASSLKRKTPVLHVQALEFVEADESSSG